MSSAAVVIGALRVNNLSTLNMLSPIEIAYLRISHCLMQNETSAYGGRVQLHIFAPWGTTFVTS